MKMTGHIPLLTQTVTAELAYKYYPEGSCMYATAKSIISQLGEKIGEPYKSFPIHLFKYGHGGVGGYGSICGTLNGAAAVIGLLVTDKGVRDKMIADVFRWYEQEPLPDFNPQSSSYRLYSRQEYFTFSLVSCIKYKLVQNFWI